MSKVEKINVGKSALLERSSQGFGVRPSDDFVKKAEEQQKQKQAKSW